MPISLRQKAIITLVMVFFTIPSFAFAATLDEQLEAKKQQIANLEKQIKNYQTEILKKDSEAKTLTSQISLLASKINKIQSEIKSLELSIEATGLEITDKEQIILAAKEKLNNQRIALAYNLELLYRKKINSPLIMLIQSENLDDYLRKINDLINLENGILTAIDKIEEGKKIIETEKSALEDKQSEQEQLKALEEVQQREAAARKTEQSVLLGQTKKKKSELASLLNLSKSQVEQLRDEIFYLQKNGIGLEDAIKYGQIVAERANIRAAFLLALLEIESGLGTNIGSGRYKTDMNPNQWDYFLKITTKLGRDPETTPVSKKPNYGWGGAMGAAQFLPGTWLGYEAKIAQLTGHNPPSPWRIEDSFMAAALKLSRDGASSKTKSGELAAAKTYLSGNPNCTKSICNWYANMVLEKAIDIEKNLTPQ